MQSFTARMPLLTVASASGLGRRRWSCPQECYLHHLHTSLTVTRVLPCKQHRQMCLRCRALSSRLCTSYGKHASIRSTPIRSRAGDSRNSTSHGLPFATHYTQQITLLLHNSKLATMRNTAKTNTHLTVTFLGQPG